MTKYLVTGGTGFIGSSLVKRLVDDGHDVRILDNGSRGHPRRLARYRTKVELLNGDVRLPKVCARAVEGVDSVLHLAAVNGTENFYNRPDLVLDVGVRGMLSLMDAAAEAGVKEFVLASSSEAYQTPSVIPTPELVPLMIPDPWNPRYSYGGSKLISEIMLACYHRDSFERVMTFRPHNVYGPDMGWKHVLPQLITRAAEQCKVHREGPVPFPIQGDGTQTRAFVHIDDFIDGLMVILKSGEHRNVYHIGTNEERTIAEIVKIIFNYFGRTPAIEAGESPVGGTERRCPDVSKLEALGYAPKVALAAGIAEMADWYVAHPEEEMTELS